MNKNIAAALLCALAAGCGSRGEVLETSPDDPNRVTKRMVSKGDNQNVVSRGVITKVRFSLKDRSSLQSHSDPVCMLAGALPEGVKYREVGRINAIKRTYGSVDEVLLAMADEGRRIGVDAILGLQSSQRAGGVPWRFSAPAGVGMLVKLDSASLPLDCEKIQGKTF
jgi:hypothetical protein